MVDRFSLPVKFKKGSRYASLAAEAIRQQTGVAAVCVTYFAHREWYKSKTGTEFPGTSIPNMLYRRVTKEMRFIQVVNPLSDPSYKFIILNMQTPMIRYIAVMPIISSGVITGAIILMDCKRNSLDNHIGEIEKHAHRMSKYLDSIASDGTV